MFWKLLRSTGKVRLHAMYNTNFHVLEILHFTSKYPKDGLVDRVLEEANKEDLSYLRQRRQLHSKLECNTTKKEREAKGGSFVIKINKQSINNNKTKPKNTKKKKRKKTGDS